MQMTLLAVSALLLFGSCSVDITAGTPQPTAAQSARTECIGRGKDYYWSSEGTCHNAAATDLTR